MRASAVVRSFPRGLPFLERERHIYETRLQLLRGQFAEVLRGTEVQHQIAGSVESKRMTSYRAWALLETNQPEAAAQLLEALIAQYAGRGEAAQTPGLEYFYYFLARIQFEAQGTDPELRKRAVQNLRESLKLRAGCARANERLAFYLGMDTGTLLAGPSLFDQDVTGERRKFRDLKRALYHVLSAIRLYEGKIGAPVGVTLEELTRLKPVRNAVLLGTVSLILVRMRVFYLADRILREAVDIDPKNPSLYYTRALMAQETGQREQATAARRRCGLLLKPWESLLRQRSECMLEVLSE